MLLKAGRRKPAPGIVNAVGSGLSGWQLVVSVGGRQVPVQEVGLRATSRGLGVIRSEERTVKSWPWDRVLEIRVRIAEAQSDGTTPRLIELHADGGRHVFLCSEAALAAFSTSLEKHAPQLWTSPPPVDMSWLRLTSALSTVRGAALGWLRSLRARIARLGSLPARLGSLRALPALFGSLRALPALFGRLRALPARLGRNGWRRSSTETGATGPIQRSREGVLRAISTVRNWREASLRQRLAPLSAGVGALALIGGGLAAGSATFGSSAPASSRTASSPDSSIMARMEHQYDGSNQSVDLPAATTPPAPAPPSLAGAPPLKSHEIFGFAPYWTLPEASGFALNDLTTIAYFSVDVNADGSIDRSGPGWAGYESQDLSDLITASHAAGVRVVLTATCFDQATLNALSSSPTAASTLASSLVELLQAKNLDGVNLDFEGQGSEDSQGLDHLVAQVSQTLDAADPHYQLTMDTYASSAGDPQGFYDIAGLAPYVDAFFVMGYDMDDPSTPSPNAALSGSSFNDQVALEQYTAVVPASKVILGVPYYGYDWPTSGPAEGDPATGAPSPVSYAQVMAGGSPIYWDPSSQTPWTSYQVGTQWHQSWFDDPTSLALKTQMAASYHIAGVGVWALGMDANSPSMIAALLGDSPVVKDFEAGPTVSGVQADSVAPPTTTTPASPAGAPPQTAGSPPASASPTTTTTSPPSTIDLGNEKFTGTWDDKTVDLALSPAAITPLTTGQPVGQLTGFSTNDPAYSCLESAASLPVYSVIGEGGTYEVETTTPTECAKGTWQFSGQPPTGSSAVTQNTTANSASSTTVPTGTSSSKSSSAPVGSAALSSLSGALSSLRTRHPLPRRDLRIRRIL